MKDSGPFACNAGGRFCFLLRHLTQYEALVTSLNANQ